jgi:tRNA uridine 5-carboxymethylaminomethyl modification enzyme
LLLREDNADMRLRAIGQSVGAVDAGEFEDTIRKQRAVVAEITRLEKAAVVPGEAVGAFMRQLGLEPPSSATTVAQLLRRPEMTYEALAPIDAGRAELAAGLQDLVEVEIKYAGYIKRQQDAVERFRLMDDAVIPADLDYTTVAGLSSEAKEKLAIVRPASIGQAGRIPGMTPAALSLLAVHLKRHGRPGAARHAS